MADSHDLSHLDPASFEHMVNALAMRVLGAGHTSFGPGSDGGRDGYFEGEAPYPSQTEKWKGTWYIQSKFHKPHLTKNPNSWLTEEIQAELRAFEDPKSNRKWPDIWIVATNIDPSGNPLTGSFEKARRIVGRTRPKLKSKFHIWGGKKIIDLLAQFPDVAAQYGHFLTPGHILTSIYDGLKDATADLDALLRFLIVRQFEEHKHAKLEQAGSPSDNRPGIHKLFVDLPFRAPGYEFEDFVLKTLVAAGTQNHRFDPNYPDNKDWRWWRRHPIRARVWFVKGGPGQGKSTIGQFMSQIQRAALILQPDGPQVSNPQREEASEIKDTALGYGFWPSIPRIPIIFDLKDYAQWLARRKADEANGILTYFSAKCSAGIEQKVEVGLIKRALRHHSWFVAFDGLDEVPSDVKDKVAGEVMHFLDSVTIECGANLLAICTSRPQGYSGQFAKIDGPTIELVSLPPAIALKCAMPVVGLGRTKTEASKALQILEKAILAPSIRELMTTPLQAHIMAVIVRNGDKPPERRWQLFNNFYQVIKRREANKNFDDERLAKLLREDEKLLKTLHNRLGFLLHARAETSQGAQTHLKRNEFRILAVEAVSQLVETGVNETVDVLMTATIERLVLVTTPDDGDHLRFDIRPLQEFFAAEFIYESVTADQLRARLQITVGDSHWREVMHFLFSSLVENDRQTELAVAIDVVESLDNGDGDGHTRLLSRRIGRGAILVARLLQEGVLEQDKRNRQKFRNSLLPLAVAFSGGPARSLIEIQSQNSKDWLVTFLIDSLKENRVEESIGAAITLPHLLKSDDPRVPAVSQQFLNSPLAFRGEVFAATVFYSSRKHQVIPVQAWFLRVLLKTLSDENWNELGESGVSGALFLLEGDAASLRTAATEAGFNDSQIELVGLLALHRQKKDGASEFRYGLVSASHFDYDWTTGTGDLCKWVDYITEEESRVQGLFTLIYRVFKWNRSRDPADFKRLLQLITPATANILKKFPTSLVAFLPLDQSLNFTHQIENLRALSDEKLRLLHKDTFMVEHNLRRPQFAHTLLASLNSSISEWKQVVHHFPRIALMLYDTVIWAHGPTRPIVLDHPEAIETLVRKVLDVPEVLVTATKVWGLLVSRVKNRELELRRAFLKASEHQPHPPDFIGAGRFHPLKLILPAEATLLPHMVNAIVTSVTAPWGVGSGENLADAIRSSIRESVTSDNDLESVMDSATVPIQSKAAAAFCLLVLSKDGDNRDRYFSELVNGSSLNIGPWFWASVSTYLMLFTSEKDEEAKKFLCTLLEHSRTNFQLRRYFIELFEHWRETSQAPVNRMGITDKWLAGAA